MPQVIPCPQIINNLIPIPFCRQQREHPGYSFGEDPEESTYSAGSGTSEPLSLTQEAATTKLTHSETEVPPSDPPGLLVLVILVFKITYFTCVVPKWLLFDGKI